MTGRRAAIRRRTAASLGARGVAVLAVATAIVLAAPVSVVALLAFWMAWRRGWRPGRLYRAAAWSAPMVAVWLAATAIQQHDLLAVAQAPYHAWLACWRAVTAHGLVAAGIGIAPAAIPLGLLAGGIAWSLRNRSMAARAGGASPGSAIAFDERQWRHQVRSATARIQAPGSVPLISASGNVPVGAVIRTVGHPDRLIMELPAVRLHSHQLVLGGPGTGKTTLLLRLWAGFLATSLRAHAAGLAGPPLLVVLDAKGGADARRIADRVRRVLREAGARRVAIWPDEASLSLWALPPHQLVTTLVDLIEHGTGGAAYYTDVMDSVVALAVDAPCGPPASTADFVARLDPDWLALAYSGRGDQLQQVRAAARQVPDITLRFRTLFRRLGAGLDGPGSLADADVWYCILEGTGEIAVAEAQARALVDLLASYVTGAAAATRQMLLAVDEFSAVARRLPIWQLYERARSLGLAVQVSAQSWHGLAPTESDRYRIATAAEGGIWLLRTAHPEPVTGLAGQRKAVDSTRQLLGFPRWSRQGSSRVQDAPVADPARIRALDRGQSGYLYRGGVTYVLVKKVVAGPAALPGPDATSTDSVVAVSQPAAGAGPELPDITPFLDEAFGPARTRAAREDAP